MVRMIGIPETLDTPLLLIAMPQVQDPVFNRSVVLLLEHSDQGSLGLVLNRPTELLLRELLEPLEIEWQGEAGDLAYLGGPVSPNVGTLLFRRGATGTDEDERVAAVSDGLLMTQDVELLREIAVAPPDDSRLILGYAGWSEGQLEEEIERSDWLLGPCDAELVFGGEVQTLWQRALQVIGVRPESLPSVSRGSHDVSN